jgi:hypothetical protein
VSDSSGCEFCGAAQWSFYNSNSNSRHRTCRDCMAKIRRGQLVAIAIATSVSRIEQLRGELATGRLDAS